MKARIVLLLAFIFASDFIFAQDWQSVRSGGEYYFSNPSGEIKAIRIDSVKTSGNHQFFYNYSTIRSTGDFSSCATAYGDSWIGRYVICRNDGMNFFLNYAHDTIRVKTTANLNEVWNCFSFADGKHIDAKVSSISSSTFLGITDSVKTISLQLKDQLGNPVIHFLNNYELKLSKHCGLIKTANFYRFPDSVPIFSQFPPNEIQSQFEIYGMTNPQSGKTNISFHEVFDFQAGDEFHSRHTFFSWQPPGQIDTTFTIKKVLERINYPGNDSVKYSFERIEKKIIYGQPSSQIIHTWDTISEVIYFNAFPSLDFNKLPGELIRGFYISNDEFVMQMNLYCNERRSKTIPGGYGHFVGFYPNDSCMQALIIMDGCLPEKTYIEGCGGPYGGCAGAIMSEHNELLFYKKGTEQCGTPLDPGILLGIDKAKTSSGIKLSVYPNPACDNVSFAIENAHDLSYVLELSNLLGQIVLKKQILQNSFTVNLSALPKGVYHYQLKSKQQSVANGKLLLQ